LSLPARGSRPVLAVPGKQFPENVCHDGPEYSSPPQGIYLEYGTGNTVSHSQVTSDPESGAYVGFNLCAEAGDSVFQNTSTGSVVGFLDSFSGYDPSTLEPRVVVMPNTYTANTATRSYEAGFYVTSVVGPWEWYGFGIVNLIRNQADHTHCTCLNAGFYLEGDFAETAPGMHALITGNKSSANDVYGFYDEASYGSAWSANEAEANGYDGFYFLAPRQETIVNNQSTGNSDDGFDLYTDLGSDLPASFSKNTATSNGNYGFEADVPVPGAGNTPVGNTFGCSNVAC
jgi:hypothetical protein